MVQPLYKKKVMEVPQTIKNRTIQQFHSWVYSQKEMKLRY
jgi:hypothetical protein